MKDNRDDFETDMDFEPATSENQVEDETQINGNTLDYYNEDMSRKAVGRLFGKPKYDNEDDEGIVKGYSKTAASVVTAGAKPESKPETTSKKPSWDEDPGDDSEYDFSLYRRKEKKDPLQKEPARPEAVRSRTGRNEPVRKESVRMDVAKIQPIQTATSKLKKYDHFEDDYPEDFEEYEEYEEDATGSAVVKRIIIGSIIFILLIVLAILVYKMNDSGAKLEQSLANEEKSSTLEQQVSDLQIELATKQEEIDLLTTELNALKNAPNTGTPEDSDEAPIEPTDSGTPESQGTATPNTPQSTTYTVVSGDTLSSLSKKFYGTLTDYQKIKDANGLTSDNLALGQKLVIPK